MEIHIIVSLLAGSNFMPIWRMLPARYSSGRRALSPGAALNSGESSSDRTVGAIAVSLSV